MFLPKGHLKQLVLVQHSLTVTKKASFLSFPVTRVVSNQWRLCILLYGGAVGWPRKCMGSPAG